MFTGAQLKSLGKRLRQDNYGEADLRLLDELRAELDAVLLSTATATACCLAEIPAAIAGRAKRTRSIIRKLCRPANQGMDLSRMEDLVGLRVVVPAAEFQQHAVDLLSTVLNVRHVRDYRAETREYRAVHVIATDGPRLIEIQVRTIAQQLWANESECFGETVKEGGGDGAIREYLCELASACYQIDQTREPAALVHPFFDTRQTITARLPLLRELHKQATSRPPDCPEYAYVVVYDSTINQCTQILPYLPSERLKALETYTNYSRTLDEERYEVLILNAASEAVVLVTHPRFFPEGTPPPLLV